jgi:hypothetical protein
VKDVTPTVNVGAENIKQSVRISSFELAAEILSEILSVVVTKYTGNRTNYNRHLLAYSWKSGSGSHDLYSDGSFKKRPYRLHWQGLLKSDLMST